MVADTDLVCSQTAREAHSGLRRPQVDVIKPENKLAEIKHKTLPNIPHCKQSNQVGIMYDMKRIEYVDSNCIYILIYTLSSVCLAQ